MGIVLAPIESTPYIGGTSTGICYIDGSGNQKTDGPTFTGPSLDAAMGNEVAMTLAYTTNKATSGNDTGLLISMTDTASPGTSLPLDIQVGGISRMSVDSTGKITAGTSGQTHSLAGRVDFKTDGNSRIGIGNAVAREIQLCGSGGGGTGQLTWTSGATIGAGSKDTALGRNAAGAVEVNDGTLGNLGTFVCGLLTAVAPAATDVPVSITGAATHATNYFEIGENAGTAGDVFKVDSAGDATFSGDRSSAASDATGKHTTTSSEEVHTLAAAGTSDTTTISIPSGARLLGVSFNVNTAVTGCTSWSAAFVTGSTTALATTAALTLDTKVDTMLTDEITSGIAEVRFTAVGGGASFTAGAIEVVAYFETLTSLANA